MSGLVWPVARSAQDCFLLKHWRAQGAHGAHGESLGAGYLTVWDSQTDEKCHIWAEFTKCLRGGKKKWSHLLFLLWSRLPPTPSLESLPQIAFTQAFITQLKLCYCSWHSEWATTSAKQFILAFSSRRIYGKVSNPCTNGHVLFEYGLLDVRTRHWLVSCFYFNL